MPCWCSNTTKELSPLTHHNIYTYVYIYIYMRIRIGMEFSVVGSFGGHYKHMIGLCAPVSLEAGCLMVSKEGNQEEAVFQLERPRKYRDAPFGLFRGYRLAQERIQGEASLQRVSRSKVWLISSWLRELDIDRSRAETPLAGGTLLRVS